MERGWDAIVDSWLNDASLIYGCDGNASLFYNPRSDTSPGASLQQPITWDAFPRTVANWFRADADIDRKRWAAADTLRPRRGLRHVDETGTPLGAAEVYFRQQDEYCEWFVDRVDGRIRRVVFTSEGPEYWRFLAHGSAPFFPPQDPRADLFAGDLDLVTELYREHVDDAVRGRDLVWEHDVQQLVGTNQAGEQVWVPYARKGSYNPFNPWNTLHGAMHLTHPSNFLAAEIHLAGGASVPRMDQQGSVVSGSHQLICNAGFGNPNRASDPLIGKRVNDLTRRGLSVSIAEPVGLYIADMDEHRFHGPNPADTAEAWRVTRGDRPARQILRAVFQARPGVSVDQIRVDGQPIRFGGQIADAVQIELVAAAKALGVRPRARPSLTGCCRNPDRPDFFAIVGAGQSCEDVNWERFAPIMPVNPPREPSPAAAAGRPADLPGDEGRR